MPCRSDSLSAFQGMGLTVVVHASVRMFVGARHNVLGQPINEQIPFWQQGQLPLSSLPLPVGIELFSQHLESSGLSQGRIFAA